MELSPSEVQSLAGWLDDRSLPGTGESLGVEFISGGASNELLELRRGDARLALRKPPRKVPPGRNETMLREGRILEALGGTDVPHPRVWGVCDDESVIGTTFYVMELVDGWSPMQTGTVWPAPFDADVDARRGLAFELVTGIAKLARVDWKARRLEGFGKPDGFHERQVDRWLAHLAGFQFREIPGLDVAAEWLRAHKPKVYEPGIIHGDYQFANVMFRHGAPATLAAIVDWEMATIGDPLLDLGWVMMGWPDPGEDRSNGYVNYDGMPSRAELLERYASVSGRAVDDIDYYVILARFKMAVVLEGGYARVVNGQADNPKMEAFGAVVLDMASKAAALARATP